jgi:hypothetical protein
VRITRLVVAVLAIAVAVALVLLAADLRAWRDTLRADDAAFGTEQASPDWTAPTVLPSGLSRRLLGVDDDRTLRRAVVMFRAVERVRQASQSGFIREHLRADSEAALAEVAAGAPRIEASQADDLLGVLAFSDTSSGTNPATPVERSLGSFQNAVRLDRGNDDAAYNLELLLRVLEARGVRTGQNPTPGPRASGKRGAGSGTPGRGY